MLEDAMILIVRLGTYHWLSFYSFTGRFLNSLTKWHLSIWWVFLAQFDSADLSLLTPRILLLSVVCIWVKLLMHWNRGRQKLLSHCSLHLRSFLLRPQNHLSRNLIRSLLLFRRYRSLRWHKLHPWWCVERVLVVLTLRLWKNRYLRILWQFLHCCLASQRSKFTLCYRATSLLLVTRNWFRGLCCTSIISPGYFEPWHYNDVHDVHICTFSVQTEFIEQFTCSISQEIL